MKAIFHISSLTFLILSAFQSFSQSNSDTIAESVSELRDRINGLDERLATSESDLSKLTKIKVSGYVQTQYEHFENKLSYPANSFSIRRARVKFAYEASDGVKFVVQPDLIPGSLSLKDAYAVVNHPKAKNLSLWVGQFNRPNYEVEYSSSQREVPERSKVIRALYPGERAIGAKLEYTPNKIPLLVQLALFNGNDALTIKDAAGANINSTNKDFDNFKDLMARATYSFRLSSSVGLDLGVHGYFGATRAMIDTSYAGDFTFDKTVKLGDALNRSWLGAEFQLYADLLGGTALKGEFLAGNNLTPGYLSKTSVVSPITSSLSGDTLTLTSLTTNTSSYSPNFSSKFMGYYLYFIKNIGSRQQFAVRYDYYDPNTDIKADDIGSIKADKTYSSSSTATSTTVDGNLTVINKKTTKNEFKRKLSSGKNDVAYSSFTFAWQYYLNDNIRVSLAYEMPVNEKTANLKETGTVNGESITNDYNEVFKQNTLTLRIQAKF